MTVSWVLERDVFAEVCFNEMVAHFKAKSIPYEIVRVIPMVHEIEGPVPALENPIVVYGSIGVQKLAAKHGWTPGVFGNAKTFSETAAQKALADLYLNWGQMVISIKRLGENPEAMARNLAGPHGEPLKEFFIKPNTDTKEFAGQVIQVDKFAEWYAGMVKSGYLDDNDFDVVCSRPKKLGCEWRVVVVDGKISSSSLYRQWQTVMPERHIFGPVEEVVMAAHALYQPAPAYVIDIAQVQSADDPEDWDYRVIEYNTFNSAGLYACDVAKIIDDIDEMLA